MRPSTTNTLIKPGEILGCAELYDNSDPEMLQYPCGACIVLTTPGPEQVLADWPVEQGPLGDQSVLEKPSGPRNLKNLPCIELKKIPRISFEKNHLPDIFDSISKKAWEVRAHRLRNAQEFGRSIEIWKALAEYCVRVRKRLDAARYFRIAAQDADTLEKRGLGAELYQSSARQYNKTRAYLRACFSFLRAMERFMLAGRLVDANDCYERIQKIKGMFGPRFSARLHKLEKSVNNELVRELKTKLPEHFKLLCR